jgi:hypothetical protein
MRIAYDNIVDRVTTSSIVASSALTNNPVVNVTDQRLSTRWISDTATAQTITVELPIPPDYPDNATGTTYIRNVNFTSADISGAGLQEAVKWAYRDGGAGVWDNTKLAIVGNEMRMTHTVSSTANYIRIGVDPRSKTVRLKVNVPVATTIRIDADGTAYEKPVLAGLNLIDQSLDGTGAAYLDISFYLAGTYTFSMLYIGSGLYDSVLADWSGNGFNGIISGCNIVPGVSTKTFGFDGINDKIEKTGYNHRHEWITMSVWVKRKTGTTGVYFNAASVVKGMYFESYGDIDTTVWAEKTDGTPANFSLGNNLSTTEFRHVFVEMQLNTGVYAGYVNNVLRASGTHNSPMAVTVNGLLRLGNGAGWGGELDDARIYKRQLSATERTAVYNRESFASEKLGLTMWWKLDHNHVVNTLAILGHNLKASTSIIAQGASTPAWAFPERAFIFANNDQDAIVLRFEAGRLCKYWRFVFSGQPSIQIGRLWLGEYLQVNPSSLLDLTVSKKRSDVVVYGRDRQKFANPGVGWRRVSAKFPKTNPNMIYRLEQFHDHVGNHSSFIFCNFDTSREFPLVEPLYGSLSDDLSFNHTDRQKYNYSLTIEEDK